MTLEFGLLNREELRQAAELAARAFSDYEYFTNWFPDDEERAKVEISIIWHSYKTNFKRVHPLSAKLDGKTSVKKTGPGIWYVSSLSVDPTMQGIGLGTQLLEYCENYIRERDGKQVVLVTNSQKNLNFYLKRGYELFDERMFEYNGHKMGSWSLKKVL